MTAFQHYMHVRGILKHVVKVGNVQAAAEGPEDIDFSHNGGQVVKPPRLGHVGVFDDLRTPSAELR